MMTRRFGSAGAVLRPVIEFLFPPACAACHAPVTGEEWVCAACRAGMRRADAGDPLYVRARTRLRNDGSARDFLSVYWFDRDGPVQQLLHNLKYEGARRVGDLLGREAGRVLGLTIRGYGVDGIVPVPLHRARLRERGYNQSLLIAGGLGAALHVPVLHPLLRRTRYTRSQTSLHQDERRRNVAGAFALDPRSRIPLAGRTLLLVDDVATTGATLSACAEVLRARGAEPVIACSIALAR